MSDPAPLVMFSAGEASGDRHAASLFRELKKRIPSVKGIGMGGMAMREAGIDIAFDSSGIGVIGLAEIARHYGEIRGALNQMQALARDERPDLLICVDYKEFNFRLAKAAKAMGIKVLFYVSPQVWAWRQGRVKTYGRIIDHMAVIFPFELPFYERHGVPATYVGHPLAGKVKANESKEVVRARLGLSQDTPLIGMLPGSRTNELARLLPSLLDAAVRIRLERPHARFVVFRAPTLDRSVIDEACASRDLNVDVVEGQNYDILQCCDAVMTVSGTATLEVALMGIPMVIVYRLAPLSYWVGRLLVKVPFIGLPNILSEKGIVRELIQDAASPENIAHEILHILNDEGYAATMRTDLAKVRDIIGTREGSVELAQLAETMLKSEGRE
jgi:lipid-A-disaccharide synthase